MWEKGVAINVDSTIFPASANETNFSKRNYLAHYASPGPSFRAASWVVGVIST